MKHLLSKKHCSYITNGKQCLLPAIVGTPSLSAGGGVESPIKFSKRGELDRTSTFRGGDFFQGGRLQFSHKNKLKSEIFNGQIRL